MNTTSTLPASEIRALDEWTTHSTPDEDRVEALAADMSSRGWVGAPVLAWNEGEGRPVALTGTHRIAAARTAGIDVPVVVLSDENLSDEQREAVAEVGMEWSGASLLAGVALTILGADEAERIGLENDDAEAVAYEIAEATA